METITTTDDKQTDMAESASKVADEGDLLTLFHQYSDLMSSNSD